MSLKTPVVILNFKTYLESSGEKALDLANALESAGEESGITMVAVPQAIDIYRIKEETNIPVLSQHIDAVSPGGHTGSNLFESFVASGIDGTLLNHSECRMTLADIAEVVKKTKEAELKQALQLLPFHRIMLQWSHQNLLVLEYQFQKLILKL